jgi:antitoxin HicB
MNKLGADKDIVYYMSLPYTIVLRPDEEGDFIARVQELPGCSAHGSDRNEALNNLQDVQQAWIEECLESGQDIPEPEPEDELPSGKWLQRVPRTLHKKLTDLAKSEEVSLNQLVTSVLSEAVAGRALRSYMLPNLKVDSAVSHAHANSPWEVPWAVSPGNWEINVIEGRAYPGNTGDLVQRLVTTRRLVDQSENAYKEITRHTRKADSELVRR